MSMCSVCGSQEWHDVSRDGALLDAYCPKCSPRPVTILPVDDGGRTNPVNSAAGGGGQKNLVNSAAGGGGQKNLVNSANAATGPAPSAIDPGAITFDTKATSLQMDGSKVMTAYDELPETAGEGEIAFKKGENAAYVFDGEEWQNLGAALRRAKPSVVSSRDAKCDRKAAIAATKAKMEAK